MTLLWLVALGLFNSVVSAFYYVRVLKAMFLRPESGTPLAPPPTSVAAAIVMAAGVSLLLGVMPAPVVDWMKGVSVPMLSSSGSVGQSGLRMPTRPTAPPPAPDALPTKADLRIDAGGGGGSRPTTPPPPPTAPAAPKDQAPVTPKRPEL